MIRAVRPAEDAAAICEIYNHYVSDTVVTFENDPIDVPTMRRRIETIAEQFPYLVYEQGGKVLGYAYADTWRHRTAFRRTVETTVYLHRDWPGKGIGSRLYAELLRQLRTTGFHAAVACITLPNTASVALHEKADFRKVAHFTEVGWKFDRWLDVGFWELIL